MVNNSAQFCEGCPFSNGITSGDAYVRGFRAEVPNRGFELFFEGEDGSRTHSIDVQTLNGDIASDMPQDAIRQVERRAYACTEPLEVRRGRLNGLLGIKTVSECGAFSGEKPKSPTIVAQSHIDLF